MKNQKETASTSVKNAYNSLLSEKSGYEQALESYELAKTELSASAARGFRPAPSRLKIMHQRNPPCCPLR